MQMQTSAEPFENPARWYRQHYALVWDTARRYGIPAEAREDVVQETFLAAYRRRTSLGAGSMRAWLYGIARRVAANHRRKAFRFRRKRDRLAQEVEPRAAAFPETTAAAAATLQHFLGKLKPADRELFVLSEIEGFTGPEIADAMGRNLNTTYSRIRETRQRFYEVCADGRDAVEQHRNGRPRASAASWALVMPRLGAAPAVASSVAWNVGGLVAGMAASAAVVAALVALSPAPAPDRPAQVSAGPPVAVEARAAASHRPATVREEPPVAAEEAPPKRAPAEASSGPDAAPVSPATGTNAAPARGAAGPGPRRTSAPRTTTSAAALPEDAAPADPTEDGALLRRAMRIVRSDASRAMTLVDRHEAQFPTSAMADVRAVIRVKALCGLGRGTAARALAGGYLAQHPDSPMSKQLRRGCDGLEGPAEEK